MLLCPDTIAVGLKAQDEVVTHESKMLPEKPLAAVAVTVNVAVVLPISVVLVGAEDDREKSAVPVPARATVCGLPVAESVTVREPERAPLPVGPNVMLTEQLWPTLRTFPRARQVLVSSKFVLTLIAVMSIVELPVLVRVTDWGALRVPTFVFPNVTLVGATVSADDCVTPVPVRVMVCGLLFTLPVPSFTLSVSVSWPVSDPAAGGVYVTLIVQFPPLAATVPTQLSVSLKSVVVVIDEMESGFVPSLTTVMGCAALVTVIVSFPKFSLAGETVSPGALAGSISPTKALPATPPKAA